MMRVRLPSCWIGLVEVKSIEGHMSARFSPAERRCSENTLTSKLNSSTARALKRQAADTFKDWCIRGSALGMIEIDTAL